MGEKSRPPVKPAKVEKTSQLYRCVADALGDLSCDVHPGAELAYITCDRTSERRFLCDQCLQASNRKPSTPNAESSTERNILSLNAFFDYPILAFLTDKQRNSSRLISDVIQQSSSLFDRIKEQTEGSKRVLSNYIENLIKWLVNQTREIQLTFE